MGVRSFYLCREHWYQIDKTSDSIHIKSPLDSSVICGLGALRHLWQTGFRICIPNSFIDRFFSPRGLFGVKEAQVTGFFVGRAGIFFKSYHNRKQQLPYFNLLNKYFYTNHPGSPRSR